MKNLLLFAFSICCLSFISVNDTNKLIGKWSGKDQGDIGYISFNEDGYAYFEINGTVIGGEEFTFKGKKGSMSYNINQSTSPIEIDFIVKVLETGEEARFLCIAEFIDDDHINFAMGFDGVRPMEFNSDNSIRLTREN